MHLHFPHPITRRDSVIQICSAVLSLILVSGVVGSAIEVKLMAWMHQHALTSSSDYLAFNAPLVAQQNNPANPSQATVNALTSVQIANLQTEAQADRDDRKAIHDQIYQLSQTETQHYNSLVDRLDVDETRVSTSVSVIGGLLILLNGIAVISHLLSWQEKKKTKEKATTP
jgi:Na+-transporting NADH:ubiquinone oxidoreductase subunit NqrC